jgi:hypothetical protein
LLSLPLVRPARHCDQTLHARKAPDPIVRQQGRASQTRQIPKLLLTTTAFIKMLYLAVETTRKLTKAMKHLHITPLG